MLATKAEERGQYEMICIEELVPKDHILRKIDRAIDFGHIYDLVGDLYCPDNGRPSIDPVVLFKMILIQHLFGIPSLRKTAEEVRLNVAYRWFLGYLLNEQTPHFSTLSYNFRNRYTPEIVEAIFFWILDEINNAGYLSPEAVFIDGTHIKANANTKQVIKKAVPKAAKIYEEQLMKEINEDREKHDKKPFNNDKKPPEEKIINELNGKGVKDTDISLIDYGLERLERMRNDISPHSYITGVRMHEEMRKFFGKIKLKDVSPALIQEYLDKKQKQGIIIEKALLKKSLKPVLKSKRWKLINFVKKAKISKETFEKDLI